MQLTLTNPGLFITATGTEAGKTVASCAIAVALRREGRTVGVCKPAASGCRRERDDLINDDAEALAHFADCRFPLNTINPVRYRKPLAPAVAAEIEDKPFDFDAVARSLNEINAAHDVTLVEGVGGIMVPLTKDYTVLDLMVEVGFPVVVVCDATLGTLNHTAMTCELIRQKGLRLAGIVVNRYDPESPDASVVSNPAWLAKQNRTQLLATLPVAEDVNPGKGRIPDSILEAAAMTAWTPLAKKSR
jgi:dethiobiotin synthetase